MWFHSVHPEIDFSPSGSGGFAEVFAAVSDDRLSDFLFMWCFFKRLQHLNLVLLVFPPLVFARKFVAHARASRLFFLSCRSPLLLICLTGSGRASRTAVISP